MRRHAGSLKRCGRLGSATAKRSAGIAAPGRIHRIINAFKEDACHHRGRRAAPRNVCASGGADATGRRHFFGRLNAAFVAKAPMGKVIARAASLADREYSRVANPGRDEEMIDTPKATAESDPSTGARPRAATARPSR